jgi:hypothetical protein
VRLPFGLGRRSSSGDGASGGGSSAGSAAGSGRPAAGPSAPSRAWASLPPIQRTTGPMPQVAAPHAFVGALPGSHALPPIVQPLGHEVSALATPGLIVARTRPIEVAGSSAIPTPVQRRASRGSRQTADATTAPAFAHGAEVVEHVPDVVHDAAPSASSSAAPIRSMPTVSRSSLRVPDRPLTSAASAARPAAVQRAAAPAPVEAPAPTLAAAPRTASGGMRRVPSGMPVASPTVNRKASAAWSESAPSSAVAPSLPGRSGVGEPMTSLPASARPVTTPSPVISRSTSVPMPIAASGLRMPVQRSASGAAAAPQLQLGAGPGAAPEVPAQLQLPHLPVARSTGASRSSSSVAEAAPIQRSAADAAPQIRPTAGYNPIHTSIPLQRSADDDVDVDDTSEADMPSPWWDGGEPSMRAAAPLAVAEGGMASIQRIRSEAGPASSASRVAATTYVPSPAATPGRSIVQRVAASAGPAGRSMPALPAPIGPSSRTGPGAETAQSGRWSSSLPADSAPSVQTSLARSSAPLAASFGSLGPNPVIQREGTNVAMQPATPPAAPAGPSGGGGSGPVPPTGPASSGHSEKDLDELAQALFGRIRGRLRSDLIYDREAKGLTFDNV